MVKAKRERRADCKVTNVGRSRSDPSGESLVNLQRASELVGLNPDSLGNWIDRGELPVVTYEGVGGREFRLLRVADLRAFKLRLLEQYETSMDRRLGGHFRNVAERIRRRATI